MVVFYIIKQVKDNIQKNKFNVWNQTYSPHIDFSKDWYHRSQASKVWCSLKKNNWSHLHLYEYNFDVLVMLSCTNLDTYICLCMYVCRYVCMYVCMYVCKYMIYINSCIKHTNYHAQCTSCWVGLRWQFCLL